MLVFFVGFFRHTYIKYNYMWAWKMFVWLQEFIPEDIKVRNNLIHPTVKANRYALNMWVEAGKLPTLEAIAKRIITECMYGSPED